MSDQPVPISTTEVGACADCQHSFNGRPARCPQCKSTNISVTVTRQFRGGTISKGHIAEGRRFGEEKHDQALDRRANRQGDRDSFSEPQQID